MSNEQYHLTALFFSTTAQYQGQLVNITMVAMTQ